MNKEKFESQEAKFIAKWVLNHLGITPLNIKVTINPGPEVRRTLRSIEKFESDWTYTNANNKETYGRKFKSEPIKLWSVPKKTANILSYLVLYSNSKNILELGTSAGYSTIHLANGANLIEGNVHTIENLDIKAKLAKRNIRNAGLERRINLIFGNAVDIVSNWKTPLDFVFLDADKENYGKYLDLLLPCMKVGGIIVADNINDYGHLMNDYLTKIFGTHYAGSQVYPNVESIDIRSTGNGLAITKITGEKRK